MSEKNQANIDAPLSKFGFDTTHCFIGGVWQPAIEGETLALEDPSTGATLCSIARGTAADIDLAVEAAQTERVPMPWR